MHFGNILMRKTKRKYIKYGERNTIPVLEGYIPVLMDFERSKILDPKQDPTCLYEDLSKLFNLAGTEIDVKLHIDRQFINKYIRNQRSITQKTYDELCDYIDTRGIEYISSERVMPNFSRQI